VGTQAEGLSRPEASERAGVAGGNEAGARADAAELQRAVAHALQLLSEEDRAVVVLRDIEGLDYRQIASILEVPSGTVKSRLHRARMALREAMSESLQVGS
jgi:RNA polymerase sigma-70 factor (ECF subfamily)